MENSPNNPAATVFMLIQLMIKFCDTWDRHRGTIIENQKDTIKKNDETIKKAQEKYNTLEEGKNKNDALLGEADNAMKDLRKSLEPLAKVLGGAHVDTMECIYNLNELPESNGKYIKDNNRDGKSMSYFKCVRL